MTTFRSDTSERMKFPTEFWSVFAAVMMANMLTVWMVYSFHVYTKREKGEAGGPPTHVLFGGMMLPFIFLLAAFHSILTGK